MLPSAEVPSVGVKAARDEDAAPEPSATPSAGVRADFMTESELFAAAQVILPVAQSRMQSSTDFVMVSSERPPTVE